MSLRKIVILLLIANLGYFAYGQGWLKALIGSDTSQREPERMSKQVNPAAVVIAPAPQSPPAATQTAAPIVAPAAAPELAALPEPVCTSKREEWVIYMGPYANKELRDRKKAELSGLGLASTAISKQSLKLGLSLGEYESEASAKQALTDFSTKGVKTATVVLWGTAACPN